MVSFLHVLLKFLSIPFIVLKSFFKPPCGVVIFLSAIFFCLLLCVFSNHWISYQAQLYYSQLETVDSQEIKATAQSLAQQETSGIRLLVKGMLSKQESTVRICYETLDEQLTHWKTMPSHEMQKYYFVLATELEKNSQNFNTTSLDYANRLAKKLLHDISPKGLLQQSEMATACQMVTYTWQKQQPASQIPNQFSQTPVMLASAGEPKNAVLTDHSGSTINEIAISNENNATHFSTDQKSMNPQVARAFPQNGYYRVPGVQKPIEELPILMPKTSQLDKISTQQSILPETMVSSPFIDHHLQNTTPDQMASMPTQDLMRLLNHDHWEVAQHAETLLKNRDHFQDQHIQLAGMLYHPDKNVRKSLVSQLNASEELESGNWLLELLKDPDADVRYTTAHAVRFQLKLDDNTLSLLVQAMQADTDPRIAAMANTVQRTHR